MSKSDIRLSPKYGLNPTISVCFWCGKERGDIALLGHIGNKGEDIEAPKYAVTDFEPCEECKAHWEMGTVVFEATREPNNGISEKVELANGGTDEVYPTGRWVVMTTESARRVFNTDDKKLYVDSGIFQKLLRCMEE